MGYRIQYQSIRKENRKRAFHIRRILLTILFFLLFLLSNFGTDIRYMVIDKLTPLQPARMVSMMDQIAEHVQNGTSVTAVLKDTVQRMIREAHFASG